MYSVFSKFHMVISQSLHTTKNKYLRIRTKIQAPDKLISWNVHYLPNATKHINRFCSFVSEQLVCETNTFTLYYVIISIVYFSNNLDITIMVSEVSFYALQCLWFIP